MYISLFVDVKKLIRVFEFFKKIQVSKKSHRKKYSEKGPLLDNSCFMLVKR